MPKITKFDIIWASNRKVFRPSLNGTRMRLDPSTGFLESVYKGGFTARKKAAFIERYKVCKNVGEIIKSVGIDQATFYDALALDERFREAINSCKDIPNRKKHLVDALEQVKTEEQSLVIQQLFKATENYKK